MTADTPKPPPDRPSKVSTVADWLVMGMGRSRIPAYAGSEGWTDSAAELETIIADAEAQIVEDARVDVPNPTAAQARAVRGLLLCQAGAATDGDWKTCLAARRELNRLIGATIAPAQPPPAVEGRQGQLLALLAGRYRPALPEKADAEVVAEAVARPVLPVTSDAGADAGGARRDSRRSRGRAVSRRG